MGCELNVEVTKHDCKHNKSLIIHTDITKCSVPVNKVHNDYTMIPVLKEIVSIEDTAAERTQIFGNKYSEYM